MTALTVVSITAPTANQKFDVGQVKSCTASLTGGVGPYTATWKLGGVSIGTGNATTCTLAWTVLAAQVGLAQSLTLQVVDTGDSNNTVTSAAVSINVYAALTLTVTSPSGDLSIVIAEIVHNVVTVAGGASTYTYQWTVDGSAVNGATSATYDYTPATVGVHTIYCTVTDSALVNNTAVSTTITITVLSLGSALVSSASYLWLIAHAVGQI